MPFGLHAHAIASIQNTGPFGGVHIPTRVVYVAHSFRHGSATVLRHVIVAMLTSVDPSRRVLSMEVVKTWK